MSEDSTSTKDIAIAYETIRDGFYNERLLDIDSRLDQLRNLYYGLSDMEHEFEAALKADLNRDDLGSQLLEIQGSLKEILDCIDNVEKWAKPEKIWGSDLRFMASTKYIQYKPLGTVLIISPWNYPLFLSVPAIAIAIAAGNTVVLKPSEFTPHVSRALAHLIEKYLDPKVCQVVLGKVAESTDLLNSYKWDKIMLTGSTNVGHIVAATAAKTLTPVLLELGGKSPVLFSAQDSEIDLYAKRLVWGKFANSGQTCVAPDYILVEKKNAKKLKESLIKWTAKFFKDVDENTLGFVHTPTHKLANRLRELILSTKGNIIYGERYTETDIKALAETSKFIPPFIIENVTASDPLMKEEIFGPIIPLIEIDDITKDGVEFVNQPEFDTPLALYIFCSDKKKIDYVQKRIRAGAVSVEDTLIHCACTELPFGGIGNSGSGRYHGVHGFKEFSHEQAFIRNPWWLEFLLNSRYPPISSASSKFLRALILPKTPWFPRHGRVHKSVFQRLFGLKLFGLLAALAAIFFFLL